jgi:putative addiction module component (TIGR02574 family)
MSVIDIKNMNVADRLQTMEALWNSFLSEESDLDSPEWHQEILAKRTRKIKNGKAEFISIEDLKGSHKT